MAATALWSIGNLIVVGVDLPGPQLAFWRILFGAALYGAVFNARRGRYSAAGFRAAALGGCAFGLSAVLFFSALKLTSVASATVIAALQPVMLLPYSTRRMGERIDAARLVLMLLAVTGTVTVVLGSAAASGERSVGGDLLALAGTAVLCAYFVGTKRARETLSAVEYQAHALPLATVVALIGALVTGPGLESPPWPALGAAVVLTLVPGTGHLLMSWSQKHLEVNTTATIALDVTVLSSVGAAVVYDQPLEVVQVLGMAVVLLALALFIRRARTPVVDPSEVPVSPAE